MSKEQDFVRRWSQKKLAERRGLDSEAAPGSDEAKAGSPIAAPIPPADAGGDPSSSEELPPLDSLTKDSDFAPFLRASVSPELRLAALRKLWTSDPVWALPERLDIHSLDYTFPSVPQLVQTAYRVGQGFLDATEKIAEKAPPPTPIAGSAESKPTAGREGSPETRSDDTVIDQAQPVGCNKADGSSG
jgi:hypothetical protein